MTLPVEIFDQLVRESIAVVSDPPYSINKDAFRNNPDLCFKNFFLKERRDAIEDIASHMQVFSGMLNLVRINDVWNAQENNPELTDANIGVEKKVVTEIIDLLNKDGDFISDAYLIFIAYIVITKSERYEILLNGLFEKFSYSKEWNKHVLWTIMWFSNLDGFKEAVVLEFEEREKALNEVGDTDIDKSNSLIYNCARFYVNIMTKSNLKDDSFTVAFSHFQERDSIIKELLKKLPDLQDVYEAVKDNNMKILLFQLTGSVNQENGSSEHQKIGNKMLSDIQNKTAAFLDAHNYQVPVDFFYFNVVTNMFVSFFFGIDEARDKNMKQIPQIEGTLNYTESSSLVECFSDYAGDEKLGVLRLKLFCAALWFSDYNNFRDLIRKISEI